MYDLETTLKEDLLSDFSSRHETLPLERANDLFQDGHISADEHAILVKPYFASKRVLSNFSLLCLAVAILNWLIMLTYTFSESKYELLDGTKRLYVTTILAPVSVILFCLAIKEMRLNKNVKGYGFATAGLSLAIALLSIIVPIWITEAIFVLIL